MNTFVIGLGSNIDKAIEIIQMALSALNKDCFDLEYSEIYPTEPFGDNVDNSHMYYNCVAKGSCVLDEYELVDYCKQIETRLGRTRTNKAIVAIDIDVICFSDKILRPKEIYAPYMQKAYIDLGLSFYNTEYIK